MAGKQRRGGTWRIHWRQADRDGKQYEAFGDEAKADSFRLQVEQAGNRWPEGWVRGRGYVGAAISGAPETGGPVRGAGRSVAAWCGLAARNPRKTMTEGTRVKYESNARLYVETSALGRMAINEVTREDVDAWLDSLVARGLSRRTVANMQAQLSGAFKMAVAARAITHNPAYGAFVPGDHKAARKHYYARDWEVDALIAAMGKIGGPVYGLATRTLAETGMRLGEMRALTPRDVFQAPDGIYYMSISKARKFLRGSGGPPPIGEPKTAAGTRTISLPDELGKLLCTLAAEIPNAGDPLFALPSSDSKFSDVWRLAREAAGVDNVGYDARGQAVGMRIHDLRHYHASWLLENRVELWRVSKRLGHANLAVTANVYSALRSEDAVILDVLNTPRRKQKKLRAVS